jgi:hypothetical protein
MAVSCFCRTVLLLSMLVFRNAQCNELTLRDVINSLPTDTFVKVFFEGLRTYDILETRLPITILHHRQQQVIIYNKTTATHVCRFFHIGRNIGSRTHNIISIVALDTHSSLYSISNVANLPNFDFSYLRLLIPHFWWPILECHFIGSITQTIFLGDRVVFKMFTKHLKEMILHLGSSLLTRSAAVLFDLRRSLSYWKICRDIRAGNEFVPLCLNSHSVTPDV